MRYIFYADVYFLQNFIVKIAVLYLSLSCSNLNSYIESIRGLGSIVLVAFLGTIAEILGLLWSSSYSVFILYVYLVEVPFMMWFLLRNEKRKILPNIFWGYFFLILINGVLEILWNQFGEQGSYIFYLVFSCGAVIIGVRAWRNYTKMTRGIFKVEIVQEEKSVQINGLYDSGNRLKDPYTGKGVHIISEELKRKVGIVDRVRKSEESEDLQINSPVYVPYQSLGNSTGILQVYYVDELIIGEKQRITIQNCPVGVTKDNLFEGKNYEIILNEEVF